MISTKQTIALRAIVIVAALIISAVPSPHAYAQGGFKCLSTQTPSTGGHNTAISTESSLFCNPNLFQSGQMLSQSIQACKSGGADVKCSGSQTAFGASPNVKP